ncbi:Cna B-type domain-containing protein [Peptoniphilaceae bacterium SGI.137]
MRKKLKRFFTIFLSMLIFVSNCMLFGSKDYVYAQEHINQVENIEENLNNEKENLIKEKEDLNNQNVTYSSSNNDLSSLTFSISNNQANEKTEYYSFETLSWNISVDATSITTNQKLQNGYLDINVPSEYLRSINALASDRVKSQEVITNADKSTTLRVFLNDTINSTTKFVLPINMTVKERVTPEGYKVLPKVTLYSDNNGLVSTAISKPKSELEIIYDDPVAYKAVGSIREITDNNSYQYGGELDSDNKAFLTEDTSKLEYIDFTYLTNTVKDRSFDSYPNGLFKFRQMETIKVVDTLPTYTDKYGNVKKAFFDSNANPGWTLSSDGKTVEYIVNSSNQNIIGGGADIALRDDVRLRLKFPGAPVSDYSKKVSVNNKVKLIPKYTNQTSEENSPILEDEIKFYLDGELLSRQGIFIKNTNTAGRFIYDESQPYASSDSYKILVRNTLNYPIGNVVITEGNFDSRMYINSITESNISTSQVEKIYGVLEDGTKEEISFNKDSKTLTSVIDSVTTAKIQKYAEQVESGALEKTSVPNVPARYKKIEVHMKSDFILYPGKSLTLMVKMQLTDPYNTVITGDGSKDTLENTASLQANVKLSEDKVQEINIPSKSAGVLTKKIETIGFYKSTRGNNTGSLGENFLFTLSTSTNNLNQGRIFKNLIAFDLLPIGVTYKGYNIEGDDKDIKSVEIIDNYRDTGRTAIFIKFKDVRVSDFANPMINILVKINENAISTSVLGHEKMNENQAFLYEENNPDFVKLVQNNNKSEDVWDVDNNPDSIELISAKSTFMAKLPETVQSYKYIRRTRKNPQNQKNAVYDPNALNTSWLSDGINTNFEEYFEYRLTTKNNSPDTLDKLLVFDKLNFYEGTTKRNQLAGPIQVDGSGNFKIHYTTDEVSTDNPNVEVPRLSWTENPEDFSKVTAFYIEMNSDTVLRSHSSISFNVPVRAPALQVELSKKKSENSSYVSYGTITQFGKAGTVYNTLPEVLIVKKTWEGNVKFPVETEIYDSSTGRVLFSGIKLNEENNFSQILSLNDILLDSTRLSNLKMREVGETDASLSHNIGNKTYQFDVSYIIDGTNFTTHNKQISVVTPWTPMESPTREIKVSKEWKDSEGNKTKAPVNSIEVELYKDGKATGKKVELNATNNWSGVFKNIDVVERLGDTDYYNYTVKEVGENGNTIKIAGKWYKVGNEGNMKDGFVIENKEVYVTPEKPNKPEKPQIPEKLIQNASKEPSKNSPKTGDGFNLGIYAGVMVLAVWVLTFFGIKIRKGDEVE